jgi:hypothetical protein
VPELGFEKELEQLDDGIEQSRGTACFSPWQCYFEASSSFRRASVPFSFSLPFP